MKKALTFLALCFVTSLCAREKLPCPSFYERNRNIRRPEFRRLRDEGANQQAGIIQERLRALAQAPVGAPVGRLVLIPVQPAALPNAADEVSRIIARHRRGEDLTPQEQQLIGQIIFAGMVAAAAQEEAANSDE